MFRFRKAPLTGVCLATALLLGPVSATNADFVLYMTDGTNYAQYDYSTATLTTGGTAAGVGVTAVTLNGGPGSGVFTVATTLGNYSVQSVLATGRPAVGTSALDQNDTTITSTTATGTQSTIQITEWQTGDSVTGTTGTLTSHIGGTISPGTGTVTAQAWYDSTNTGVATVPPALAPSTGLGTAAYSPLFSTTSASFGFTTPGVGLTGIPSAFALINQATVSLTGASSETTFDMETQVVSGPAPAGVVLALAGLPFLGLPYLRRRLQSQHA
jgi:hypothetical protein